MPEKLGLSFHRTFALSRDTLRQIVETAVRYPELTFGNIREGTTLGTIQVQSARRYAIGVGLLDEHEALSHFGKLAHQHNPGLSSISTQWIMHYHMVALHRNGPAFWNHLVLNCLHPGDTLTSQSLAHEIGRFIEQDEGRQIEMDTLKKTATAFLGTYSKADALGSLGLLELSEDKKAYQVAEPAPLDAAVFAYALADYWQSIWQNRNGVNLSAVTEESGPAALFLLGSGETNQLLREMQSAGLVQLQRSIPPHQVVRLWESPDTLLEQVYA